MTGLIVALKTKGYQSISLINNRFDKAAEYAFSHIKDIVTEIEVMETMETMETLELKFTIKTHPIYGDCSVLYQACVDAVNRGLIALMGRGIIFTELSILVPVEFADNYFNNLPGSKAMYLKLADKFLEHYINLR